MQTSGGTGEQAFPGSGHQTAQEEELRRLKRELDITRQERDILKSSQHLLTGVQMKYQFIAAHQREYPVKTMRRILEVAVSGYFAWLRGWGSVLCGSIRPIARSTAVRAFTRCCERDQEHCGRKRVARLMREQGLSAKPRTHRVRTTDSQHEHPVAPNLLNRDFTASVPNSKWVADITGVWTWQGWLASFGGA